MNTAENRNMMPKLAQPKIEEPDPLDIEPLPDAKMFSKPKGGSQKVKILVEEKKTEEPIEAPLKLEKPVKKPRKKRVLSEAHKKALAEGRKKGLATRKAKAEARKAKAQALLNEKLEKRASRQANKIEKEEKATIKLAKKMKNQKIRKEYESKQIASSSADPDAEFKKFYTMMSRYENIRNNQRAKRKTPVKKTQPARRQVQQPIRNRGYGHQPIRRTQIRKEQSSNNPYLSYFT